MRRLTAACAVSALTFAAAAPLAAQEAGDPAVVLDRTVAGAEAALREREEQLAESRYRDALLEGWLLLGALAVAGGDLDGAQAAFERAGGAAVETRRPLQALALVHLQRGDAARAADLLRTVVALAPADVAARQLLAQALMAGGHTAEAVQELEEAVTRAPEDPEVAFALAGAHLRAGDAAAAERLFAGVAARRPGAESWVLIGRTYRDLGDQTRARAALERALALDPRARRAHFYLGTLALMEEGSSGLEAAMAEFRRELKLAPGDPIAQLYLGMSLVEARRPEEALAPLTAAAESEVCRRDALYFLGRAQLGLDRPAEAAAVLRQALALAAAGPADPGLLAGFHYQLGTALRRLGAEAEAAPHFAAAQQHSAAGVESARERLARYLDNAPEKAPGGGAAARSFVAPLVSPLAALDPERRAALRRHVATALARAYSNLGVLQSQGGRPGEAAELLLSAVELDPGLPGVHRALGVALFNARRFADAATVLERALADTVDDPQLRRMLALAWLNAERWTQAAELLRDDPGRAEDRALQYAYALALVRGGQPAAAEPVFAELLMRHADWPELNVLLGQASAAQGDYPAADRFLRGALQLSATVAEAHSTLAEIALRQGKLPEAEQELRAELAAHPGDERARYLLATVVHLAGRAEEARGLLRAVLARRPDFADARYLLGKVLLGEGAAEAAVEQLEAAARLAPADPNVRYQLAQAYRKLGREEQARQELETYRKLKREPGKEVE
jgi:tetratricopeptide (TPR) repeat protein